MKKIITGLCIAMLGTCAIAQTASPLPQMPGTFGGQQIGQPQGQHQFNQGNRPVDSQHSAVEAALHACASGAPRDANGRPDRSAMESCMRTQGFNVPPPRGAMENDRRGH